MNYSEKKVLYNWLIKVQHNFRICQSYIKYPCSRLGDAMDCLSDAIADIPINFEEFE